MEMLETLSLLLSVVPGSFQFILGVSSLGRAKSQL